MATALVKIWDLPPAKPFYYKANEMTHAVSGGEYIRIVFWLTQHAKERKGAASGSRCPLPPTARSAYGKSFASLA